MSFRTLAPLALLAAGCAAPAQPPPLAAMRSPNIPAAVAFLLKHQSPDGAWRSDVYAAFKDGTALTPLVLTALQDAAALPGPDTAAARAKAADFLASFVADDAVREPAGGFDYPVYTAALALRALAHPENRARVAAKVAWAKYLRARQLTQDLGWHEFDGHYGGWGYCRVIPKKPEPNGFAPPLTESNLSATVFALDALAAAGLLDGPTADAALYLFRRLQNFTPPPPGPPVPGFVQGDGGFYFVLADPVRNKAGLVDVIGPAPNVPAVPARRYGSYGSATADGLRGLLLCRRGAPPGDADARAKLAADWLAKHFRADRHPGQYAPGMEANRDAVYFYYAASAAKAFRAAGVTLPNDRSWTTELERALAARQRPDGSWANAVELVRENDPLVATAQALTALAALRR